MKVTIPLFFVTTGRSSKTPTISFFEKGVADAVPIEPLQMLGSKGPSLKKKVTECCVERFRAKCRNKPLSTKTLEEGDDNSFRFQHFIL